MDGAGHFVFDDGWVVWVGLGASGVGEAEALVEMDGGLVGAGDHEEQELDLAALGPAENFVH